MDRLHEIEISDYFAEYMKYGGNPSSAAHNSYNNAARDADMSTPHQHDDEWNQPEWKIALNLVRILLCVV